MLIGGSPLPGRPACSPTRSPEESHCARQLHVIQPSPDESTPDLATPAVHRMVCRGCIPGVRASLSPLSGNGMTEAPVFVSPDLARQLELLGYVEER
jgi:hypothetical protein